jgi:hypothetical protein
MRKCQTTHVLCKNSVTTSKEKLNISRREFCRVLRSYFQRCEACAEAETWHLNTLLRRRVKLKSALGHHPPPPKKNHQGPEGDKSYSSTLSLTFSEQCASTREHEENTPCIFKLYNIKFKTLFPFPIRTSITYSYNCTE